MGDDTKIRLFRCDVCKTVTRLPFFEGPGYDAVLEDACQRHMHGRPIEETSGRLYVITERELALLEKAKTRSEMSELFGLNTQEMFEIKNDLTTDAGLCFNRHHRPSQACIDWYDKSKALGRHVGVPAEERRYLCDFCVVSAWVLTQRRKESGQYA